VELHLCRATNDNIGSEVIELSHPIEQLNSRSSSLIINPDRTRITVLVTNGVVWCGRLFALLATDQKSF
jgi:hypothetical protein